MLNVSEANNTAHGGFRTCSHKLFAQNCGFFSYFRVILLHTYYIIISFKIPLIASLNFTIKHKKTCL